MVWFQLDFSELSKQQLEDKLLSSEERIAKLQSSLRKAAEIHRRKKGQLQDEIHDLKYKQKLKNPLGIDFTSRNGAQNDTKVPRSSFEVDKLKPTSGSVSSFERTPLRSQSLRKSDLLQNQFLGRNSWENDRMQKYGDFPTEDLTSRHFEEAAKRLKDDDIDLQEIFASAEQV